MRRVCDLDVPRLPPQWWPPERHRHRLWLWLLGRATFAGARRSRDEGEAREEEKGLSSQVADVDYALAIE